MRFEEVAEVQQGRGIRHALGTQINPRKTLERLTVVERVFEGFIGQAIPLLEEINPQHPLQADGRTSAFALGIKGFDDGQQLRPRNHRVHAREKPFAAGSLLFGGKLGVGETRLMRHAAKFKPTTRSRHLESQARGLNQRFLNMNQKTWTAVDGYISDLFVQRDAALDAALETSHAAGLPAINVAPNQGK